MSPHTLTASSVVKAPEKIERVKRSRRSAGKNMLIKLPSEVSNEVAAAATPQGMTAHMLTSGGVNPSSSRLHGCRPHLRTVPDRRPARGIRLSKSRTGARRETPPVILFGPTPERLIPRPKSSQLGWQDRSTNS